jgi:PPOX class probable F420-dependent enzyme
MRLSDEARAFVDEHRVARLATASADGEPHVVPICYARIGSLLYFVTDDKPKRHGPRALKRLANIAANPRAAVVIDDYDEDWSRLAFLLLHMEAEEVRDAEEYDRALARLRERYPQYRAMPLRTATHPMVRMTVRRWHLWRAAGSRGPAA